MYYAHFILNKKGPLAKIWLAAHWDKKLTKAQIYETNIESTIETILEPQMKLALRTSGHLLLGVCRIYSRKVKYLLADCNEAFVKIKLAFRPGLIDLPKEKQQASIEAITLPEKFPDFTLNFADINIEDMDLSKASVQQARVEDITLKEDYGTYVTMQEDDFGDMGSFGMGMDMETFMMSDMEKGRRLGESLLNTEQNEIDFFADKTNNQSEFASEFNDVSKQNENNQNEIQPMELNEINGELGVDPIDSTTLTSNNENGPVETNQTETDIVMQECNEENEHQDVTVIQNENEIQPGVVPTLFDEQPTVNNTNLAEEPAEKVPKLNDMDNILEEESNKSAQSEDREKVVSAPVAEKQIKNRRRRKIVIDEVKEIDSAAMKQQLSDTSAISGTLELAPPTRKLMNLKEIGGVDKLYTMTSRPLNNKLFQRMYSRNMITRSLADITNSNKTMRENTRLNASLHQEVSVIAENSVEVSMNGDQASKNALPLADSYIDSNDGTKSAPLADESIEKDMESAPVEKSNQVEDMDQLEPPASIYNPNIDDLLLNDSQVNPSNLEVTPVKDDKLEKKASESEDDEEEEEGVEAKKSKGKSASPYGKKKYRKSLNSTKDQTIREEEDLEETLSSDPSKNLTKRAKTMISILNKNFSKYDNVGFFELTKKNGRKNVVQKFYSLLVLTKYEIIEVTQEDSYDEIIISKGEKFESMAR
ncbi:double-strand-break repair rad21 -like protein [Brachionus plicatilis]|uniref:Double-strand-break repair rad21-like protein n=1 Tax=Brachionus plicatilis TaxID=10195 RepID=A0A3M7T406_BRAPC|nr:double-strand-break repair rad21 -like protein [Brachionus plicatilis]